MPSNLDAAFPGAYLALKVVNNENFKLPSNVSMRCRHPASFFHH